MTIPHHTHNLGEGQIWVYGLGTLRLSKAEANKDKDQVVREWLKGFEFYGNTYWIRMSAHALKTAIRDGYNPIN